MAKQITHNVPASAPTDRVTAESVARIAAEITGRITATDPAHLVCARCGATLATDRDSVINGVRAGTFGISVHGYVSHGKGGCVHPVPAIDREGVGTPAHVAVGTTTTEIRRIARVRNGAALTRMGLRYSDRPKTAGVVFDATTEEPVAAPPGVALPVRAAPVPAGPVTVEATEEDLTTAAVVPAHLLASLASLPGAVKVVQTIGVRFPDGRTFRAE